MSDREKEREGLLSLAYQLAPEIQARPLYLVEASELGIEPKLTGVHAVVGSGLDLACREAIGDGWRGRGWCIVMAGFENAEGTLIHELAHIVDGTMPWRELVHLAPDHVAAIRQSDLQSHFAKYDPPGRDIHHGIEFHRALIHLCDRARRLGWPIGWRELGAESRCPVHLLATALRPELNRARCRCFGEVAAWPMPRRFRKLWNRRHIVSAERTNP